MKKLKILFPCDYFNKKEADEAYANEYAIAKSLGFDCILFDYDRFLEIKSLRDVPTYDKQGTILYRGWMLNVFDYNLFDAQLYGKYHALINSAGLYELCHHFDKVYSYLKDIIDTPKTIVLNHDMNTAISQIKENFTDYFIMKDNVKSVKGSDFPNKISVDISVEELENLINQFKIHRDKLFTGQIIAKQYVELKRYYDTTNEWRAFYFLNQLVSVSRNSNQPNSALAVPMDLVNIIPTAFTVPVRTSNFYTVDFAETEDGNWIVIETGDGQVSGLSPNQNILEFYTKIQNYWRN